LENIDIELTRKLVENPRISIRRLAQALGVNYLTLRDRLRKLVNKGLVDFALMVSPILAGSVAAIVRVRSSSIDKLLTVASRCNRVITGVRISESNAIIVVYGRDKGDIASVIDMLRENVDGDIEVSIEYGRLPLDFKVQIRNPRPNCTHLHCNNCIPQLRNRVNSFNYHGTP